MKVQQSRLFFSSELQSKSTRFCCTSQLEKFGNIFISRVFEEMECYQEIHFFSIFLVNYVAYRNSAESGSAL